LVRSIKLGFDTFDSKIEEAAYMNGASKIDCFFSITLPQVLPSIITGLTLAFARCLAEFGATITFVSNIPGETQTLPLALYTATQIPGTEQAALRLVIISIALAFISVAIAEIVAKRANKRIMGNSN
ncbi:MAG: ABC transporter permease subunit, partial [Pelagibacterales bacterium]|nr:ABC transporter permease subunit [Pelagibacterales bacterium]